MSWRNRKMFNDSPQGIVSGLAPIPRYKEGGFVNPIDYRAGGTVDYPVGMEAGGFNFPLGVQDDSLKTSFDSAQRTQAAQIEMLQNKRNKAERKITADIEANNFVKNLVNENKKFEEIFSSCIEKSKKYDWVETSSNIEKEYELLLFK